MGIFTFSRTLSILALIFSAIFTLSAPSGLSVLSFRFILLILSTSPSISSAMIPILSPLLFPPSSSVSTLGMSHSSFLVLKEALVIMFLVRTLGVEMGGASILAEEEEASWKTALLTMMTLA